MVIPPAAAYAAFLHPTLILLAVWCVVSSLEVIAVRRAYYPGRSLGVDIGTLSTDRILPVVFASRVCSPAAMLAVPTLRLAAGIALPFASAMGVVLALLIVVIACTALLSVVLRGSDGADKIALVVCTGGALIAAGVSIDDRWLCLAGLAWIAGQVAIAYTTSGVAKLARAFWRDGSALAAAMTSYGSGHALTAAVVRHRHMAMALSWTIMLVEALFPIGFLSPAVAAVLLVALGLFHVGTAVFMGLNTYPWAFATTYPGVMMASGIVAAAIGTGR